MNATRTIDLGDGTPASPLPSATVLMLRDGPQGPEVFLLKRHGLSDVLGGAYVFPGGKVDPDDLEHINRLDRPLSELHAALGEPQSTEGLAAAVYVAAIREVFEEAGVLFAGSGAEDPALPELRGQRFDDVLGLVDAPLRTELLVPWSRWLTPVASVRARKHFDARFFVATVPPGQVPAHDRHETTESAWLAPQAALRAYWEGRIQLPPPQIMSLAHLSRHRSVASVLAQALARKPPRIQPEVFHHDGVQMVCYPGDERHSVRERALPGPTRLCWRNERYEPEGGVEALLA